ncbi:MAG: arylsulfatase [Armatimonadota bacterium]
MAESTRPNIIFLMADDMGYGDIGCYGAEKIPTPNMDRLASQGVRFTDAHSPSAVCTPTRYGVLTGRYCWRTRLTEWVQYGFDPLLIEPDRMTVPGLLKRHGYGTAAVGKWHLGFGTEEEVDFSKPLHPGPVDLGFDYFFGISASLDMPPYCFIEDDHIVGELTVEKAPLIQSQRPGPAVPGFDEEEVGPKFCEKAIDFIRDHHQNNPDDPFFLYMTPSAPHRPCTPPNFLRGASDAGLRGDMVCEVDWTVGELMKTLDELEMADNTLFIVTSDNGARATCFNGKDYGHKSAGPLRGQKADIWDGGHREPFIARWPEQIDPGTTSDEVICLTDLMATSAAICGDELPDDAGEDSYNILPALLGEKRQEPIREATVHHSGAGHFSIRQGPWKLCTELGSGGFTEPREKEPGPGEPEGQLYHLGRDLAETKNLYDRHPEIAKYLEDILERYKKSGRSRPPWDETV